MRRPRSTTNEYREQLRQQVGEAAATAERNRLARDLHDSIKQQLFSIRMSALVAQAQIEQNVAKAQEALADIQQSATEAQVEMQALLQQLRSTALEHTSFAEAVRTQAQALEYRSGARVQVELADLPTPDRCPLAMQEGVFRIVQEAFANIARHARASQVECVVTHDEQALHVLIRDDGQGFDLQGARQGMGLANIQERARGLEGVVKIESTPGQGTTLRVQVPLFLPAAMQQERERREQKTRDLTARARVGLQLRSTMAVFTLLMLLIDIDQGLFTPGVPESRRDVVMLLLSFCLFMMFYGLASARVALARLKAYQDTKDHEIYQLRLQEHVGWTASLRLTLFASWHVVLWIGHLFLPTASRAAEGCLLAVGAFFLGLILFEHWQLKKAQDSYYHLLGDHGLKMAVARRWNKLRIRIMLALCIAISISVNGLTPLFSPFLLWQWLACSFLFAFFVQCMSIVIDAWYLRPWRKLSLQRF